MGSLADSTLAFPDCGDCVNWEILIVSLSNKLIELLSGYLDNQLNADELREVEAALQNPEVQGYLSQLRSNRESLMALAQQSRSALRADFAKLVMAQVVAQSAGLDGFGADGAGSEKVASGSAGPTPASQSRSTVDSRVIAAVVAIAATLVLAVYFSQNRSSTVQPASNDVAANSSDLKPESGLSSDGQSPRSTDLLNGPSDGSESVPNTKRLVTRDDFVLSYLLTLDVEIAKGQTSETTIWPLLQQYGIQLVKGARVSQEVEKALDDIRITKSPQDFPPTTEVYLISATLDALDSISESIRTNQTIFTNVRVGMAYETPSDPLIDKLSADVQKEVDVLSNMLKQESTPIALGQAIANSVVDNQEVTVGMSFASPLVADDDARPSPFDSIPEQGKLISSSGRRTKSTLRQQSNADGEKGFVLLFIRQAK